MSKSAIFKYGQCIKCHWNLPHFRPKPTVWWVSHGATWPKANVATLPARTERQEHQDHTGKPRTVAEIPHPGHRDDHHQIWQVNTAFLS